MFKWTNRNEFFNTLSFSKLSCNFQVIIFIGSHGVIIVREVNNFISTFKGQINILSISSKLFVNIYSEVGLPGIHTLSKRSGINELNRVPNALLEKGFSNSLGNIACTIEDYEFGHIFTQLIKLD